MPQLIEFALSLILLFFMLSMVVSSLTEYWNSRVGKNFRSGLLYEALLKMLNGLIRPDEGRMVVGREVRGQEASAG